MFAKRFAPLVATLSAACAPAVTQVKGMSLVESQWRSAEASSPLIAEAYLQSLIALSDQDPLTAYQARNRTLKLAQEAGLIAFPSQACASCPEPKAAQGYAEYRVCLAWRVKCLGSR